jgi:hypothetical protein
MIWQEFNRDRRPRGSISARPEIAGKVVASSGRGSGAGRVFSNRRNGICARLLDDSAAAAARTPRLVSHHVALLVEGLTPKQNLLRKAAFNHSDWRAAAVTTTVPLKPWGRRTDADLAGVRLDCRIAKPWP